MKAELEHNNRPANVALAEKLANNPADETALFRLSDGSYVWAAWAFPTAYYWGPISPALAQSDEYPTYVTEWRHVDTEPSAQFVVEEHHVLTLSTKNKLEPHPCVDRDSEEWSTLWARPAFKVLRVATPEEVAKATRR